MVIGEVEGHLVCYYVGSHCVISKLANNLDVSLGYQVFGSQFYKCQFNLELSDALTMRGLQKPLSSVTLDAFAFTL